MRETAHRRFAITVVANLKDALQATRQLVRNELEPQAVSIIGQETAFACDRDKSIEFAAIVNGGLRSIEFKGGPGEIVSLACEPALPKAISEDSDAFERMLRRWLFLPHATRLAQAVAGGEFLLLVELHSLVEERIATRTLLRNCRGSVEVHDFDMTQSTEEFSL